MKLIKCLKIICPAVAVTAMMSGCATMDMAKAERFAKECEQELSSKGAVVNGTKYSTLYEAEKAAEMSGKPEDQRAVDRFQDRMMTCIEGKAG